MINYKVDPTKVNAKFKELTSQSPQMGKALDAFANVLVNRIKLGFRGAKSPRGNAWKPLKFRTGAPLRNTGNLLGSIVAKRDGDGVLVGTNLRLPNNGNSLGAVHQFGMTILPKKGKYLVFPGMNGKGLVFAKKVVIPARPFMPLDAAGAVALPPAWEKTALNRMSAALGLK